MSQLPRKELAEIFFQEITNYLPETGLQLAALQKNAADDEAFNKIRRLFHTIKEAASQTDFPRLKEVTNHCENIIETAFEKNRALRNDEIDFLRTFYQNLNTLCTRIDRTQALEQFNFDRTSFSNEVTSSNITDVTQSLPDSNKTVAFEKKEIIQSILPLLRELTDCSNQVPLTELSHSVIIPLSRAINILADCTLTANFSSQHDLLSNFYVLLDRLAQSPELLSPEIPTLLQEYVTYLDLVFSLPSEESQRVVCRIQDRIHAISKLILIGNKSSLQDTSYQKSQAPPPKETDTDKTSEEKLEEVVFTQDKEEEEQTEQNELLAIFKEECEEHLRTINSSLNTLEQNITKEITPSSPELLDTIADMRRAVHTLKGAAGMTGFLHVASSAHRLEDLLDWLHDEATDITKKDLQIIDEALDCIEKLSQETTQQDEETVQTITERIQQHLDSRTAQAFPEEEAPLQAETLPSAEETSEEKLEEVVFPQDEEEKEQTEQNELLAIFKEECEEHLRTINSSLNTLEQNITKEITPSSPELLDTIADMRRAVHTLKGAAGMTGFLHVASSAHRLEDLLDWLHDEATDITKKDLQIIDEALDCIEKLSQETTQQDEETVQTITERIQQHLDSRTAQAFPEEEPLQAEILPSAEETSEEKPEEVAFPQDEKELDTVFPDAATALSETTHNVQVKLEDLEKLAGNEEELVTARGSLERLLGQVTSTLAELAATKTALSQKTQELEVGFEVQSLYGFGPSPAPGAQQVTPDTKETTFSEFDPIELDQYSQLNLIIRSLNEISTDVSAIYNQLNGVINEMHRNVSKQQITMKMMQERLMQIRMTPLSSISRIFYRTVRQTAKTLNKEVRLVLTGEDVYMDRHIWAKIVDPLVHILRNSIDHGIEKSKQRKALGKPETGQIRIDAEQRNRYVIIRISDDGQGVDTKALFKQLAAKNLIDITQKYTDEELLNFLFQPSFSTKKDISQISGRGVGLDVVSRNIQELRGKATIENKEGQGLSFTLQIPVTLAINKAIIITLAGKLFAVPIQDIVEVYRFHSDELTDLHNNKVLYHGEQIEAIDLASCLQLSQKAKFYDRTTQLMLLIKNDATYQAMRIDNVVEQREIVIKPLGSHLRYVRGINGVTLTGEGQIIPILNLQELALTTQKTIQIKDNKQISHHERTSTTLQVLIVDDSVSVRHFTSLLIKRQSWVANQAVDGIDALEKLTTYRPDIIILDIEMPRMNGYELLAALKNKKEYANIPVIMLTSRSSDKHQKKAKELGAAGYTTKPYKEEEFIALIQQVVLQNK